MCFKRCHVNMPLRPPRPEKHKMFFRYVIVVIGTNLILLVFYSIRSLKGCKSFQNDRKGRKSNLSLLLSPDRLQYFTLFLKVLKNTSRKKGSIELYYITRTH